MIKEIRCNIKGRVQLVMFRNFTRTIARALGLKGYVKNLKDGSVEVLSQGEKENLKEFLIHLNKGPILARVDSIGVSWMEPKEEYEGFNIVY
jgi:acylphosphatase